MYNKQLIEETLKAKLEQKALWCLSDTKTEEGILWISSNDDDKKIWCAIQLGDTKYTKPITELLKFVIRG